MPVPYHLLASFRGTLGPLATPLETWSFGLRFAENAATDPISAPGYSQATANAMHVAAATFFGNSAMLFSTDVYYKEVRLYTIGSDGKATTVPTIGIPPGTGAGSVPVQGAAGTNKWPWQCSLVVSLVARGLGKGRFGRIYLPPMGINIGTDGLIGSTLPGPMLTALQTFLLSCDNAADLSGTANLCVIGGTGGGGTARSVNDIRVGRVVDTQRRRRRSLGELYSTALHSANVQA